jgi:UDP-N-acetylmuramoyl-L-alanyl-D-glutamate--2,6-diaminopimelate ligase
MGASADVRASAIALNIRGSRCRVNFRGNAMQVDSPLTGRFNISNILAAVASGFALGFDAATIREGIARVQAVRGRFEQVAGPNGWTAIIDYAHTPDALENCLRTVREVMPPGGGHRIVTVFGCGGNRDKGKRPLMGRIAATLSDVALVTSDNPRHEDPLAIIREIMTGTGNAAHVQSEPDRRKAIRLALAMARPGDVVLIAGKGHETYQVVGETKHHFDDREEVENFIREQG